MLKAIKGLTMNPAILDDIENCNTIEVLVRTLDEHYNGPCGTEISNQILNSVYNCKCLWTFGVQVFRSLTL